MLKHFSMLLLAGAISVVGIDSAWACGGCGMSGGGGRAVASRKVMGGGANLAQARPQAIRQIAPSSAGRAVAVTKNHSAASRTKTAATTTANVSKAAPKKPLYTCPMHPQIQWTSAVDCPICGMKLKPKAANKPNSDDAPKEAGEHAGMAGMDDMMMCCPCCMGGK